VRQIRHITTGAYVGILCVNLDMANIERIRAAEFHNTFISLNGKTIIPAGSNKEEFHITDNWIKTNRFTPVQTFNSVFEITNIIPRGTLFAPVYSMTRRAIVVLFVSLIISLALILQIVNEAYVQKLQKERLFSRQKEMQLKILSNQINPHFLYNTLETIRMMALGKNEKEIAATIKMLSQILRQTLSVSDKTVPLATEIELVRNYLSIQKLRFGNRMDYSIDIDEKARNCEILPLLIQPLVENSLIHGLETKQGGGYIKILIAVNENTLYIDVTDNGTGIEPRRLEKIRADLSSGEDSIDGRLRSEASSIGLMNVNRRIKLYYGGNSGLTVSEGEGSGITVRLVIPLT
jgi:two-component system sensor histidine kinase YesM